MRMKQLTAIVTAALLAILVTAPAFAQQPLEPRVPADWDTDNGGTWAVGTGETAPATWPTPPLNTAFQIGDEDRGVFSIADLDNTSNGTNIAMDNRGELAAIFYDLELINAVFSPTSATLQFGGAGRNPLGTPPAGTGGVVEIYENDGSSFTALSDVLDPNGGGDGPTEWTEGTGGARDSFPSVGGPAGSSLWLSGRFVQLTTVGGQPVFLEQQVNFDGSASTFNVGLDLVSGSAFSSVKKDAETLPGTTKAVDMVISSTFRGPAINGPNASTYQGTAADSGNWQSVVTDPFQFTLSGTSITAAGKTLTGSDGDSITGNDQGGSSLYAPEPGAASLLGLGLLGLLAFRRKKE